jgi:hypothetical protein
MNVRDYEAVLAALRKAWLREGVQLWPAATSEQVRDFEQKHSTRLPADLVQFFLEAGGMKNPDSHHLRVWPISELALISGSDCAAMGLPEPSFWFADYLISSHVYAIHLGAANPIFVTGGGTAMVAESFEAFLQAYLADPDSILALDKQR